IERERGNRHKSAAEWDKLVSKGDPNAAINVFFMPWEGTDERRPSSSLGRYQEYPSKILERDGNFICDDGMTDEEVKIVLPHMIGRFLGCAPTFSDREQNQLMHIDRAEGRGNGAFIPKDCANTMN